MHTVKNRNTEDIINKDHNISFNYKLNTQIEHLNIMYKLNNQIEYLNRIDNHNTQIKYRNPLYKSNL